MSCIIEILFKFNFIFSITTYALSYLHPTPRNHHIVRVRDFCETLLIEVFELVFLNIFSHCSS